LLASTCFHEAKITQFLSSDFRPQNPEKPLYQALFTPYSFTLDIKTTHST
jgi:hypothetical protein